MRMGASEYADTVESERLAELNRQYKEAQEQIAPLMAQLVRGSEARRTMTPEQIMLADRMEDDINKTLEPLFATRKRLQSEIEGENASIN